jgi:hypothetical protein
MFVSPQTFLNNHSFWLKPKILMVFIKPPAKAGGNKNQSHAAN